MGMAELIKSENSKMERVKFNSLVSLRETLAAPSLPLIPAATHFSPLFPSHRPHPPSLNNLHTLFRGRVVLKILAGGGPIWTAWPILVLHRASTSAAPLLLSFVLLFLSSLHSISISLCGIYECLLQVDLAGTSFLSFCCLLEAWCGSLLRLSPPFLKTRFVTSNRWRDLHWLWMFSWQWI